MQMQAMARNVRGRNFIFLVERQSAPIPDREAHVDDRLEVEIMEIYPKEQRGQGLGAAPC